MDIFHVVKEARRSILATGHILPTLYLELENTTLMFLLDIFSDTQSIPIQCDYMFSLGREECKKYPDQKPCAAAFYSEAWASSGPSSKTRMKPCLDPKKREIIIVSIWQVDDPQKRLYTLPVERDQRDQVVNVGPVGEPKLLLSSHLDAFLQGVQDAQKSDEEVLDALKQNLMKSMTNTTSSE
jgi:hypothetical protein